MACADITSYHVLLCTRWLEQVVSTVYGVHVLHEKRVVKRHHCTALHGKGVEGAES